MAEEYTIEMQKLYLEFLVSDHELFVRCNSILDPDYFHRSFKPTVKFIREYVDQYGAVPERNQIHAKTGLELQDIGRASQDHRAWFVDDFEQFCQHKGLEGAILKSTDLLEKAEYGAVEQLIKEAVSIGIAKEFGVSFWHNPAEQIQQIKDSRGQNSTGWETIDKVLYGGFNPGELNIFAGGSGSGKSLFMQNMALNWSLAGKNVVYISLELSEQLCNMRMFSMLTDMSTRDVMKNGDDVAMKVNMAKKKKKAGELQVIQMPNGSTINDIKAYLKEYQIQHDITVDALFVDYLDLMMPVSVKVNPSDQFIKDKYVSEELRNLATELGILFVTASQLNRSSVDEVEFDHSHIAGGISKINTADNLIGIFSSRAMRERGRVQVQFMKTRSSSGVGTKLDLCLNVDSLRITDLDEDDDDAETVTTNGLYNSLSKKKADMNGETVNGRNDKAERAIDSADKLKAILKRID